MVKYDNLGYPERQIAQAVCYILRKTRRKMKMDEILSIIYLSDRYHLRKYGRTVLTGNNGCKYFAKGLNRSPINVAAEKFLKKVIKEGGLE